MWIHSLLGSTTFCSTYFSNQKCRLELYHLYFWKLYPRIRNPQTKFSFCNLHLQSICHSRLWIPHKFQLYLVHQLKYCWLLFQVIVVGQVILLVVVVLNQLRLHSKSCFVNPFQFVNNFRVGFGIVNWINSDYSTFGSHTFL